MVFALFLKASKIFRSILEMLGNLRVIRKSYEELGIRLSQFVRSLTADHYCWCSGGVPCCFEGVPGYYGMFQGCSWVVPGCSELFRGCSGVFRGCSGAFQVLQTPAVFLALSLPQLPEICHNNSLLATDNRSTLTK